MKPVSISLSFAVKTPRDEAIEILRAACGKTGVVILDCRMFSNLSLVLHVEGKLAGVRALCADLAEKQFRMDAGSRALLDGLAALDGSAPVAGSIQVTFATADGSLVIPVPMVPG